MPTKVLAVDDAPDVRHLIQSELKKAGFRVLTAVDGQDGLNQALAQKPDVVLREERLMENAGTAASGVPKTRCDGHG